jgi:CRP-like cAMP-binding protein
MLERTGSVRPAAREIRVLEADPDLARQLDPAAAREAVRRVRVRVATVPEGRWDPRLRGDAGGALGLLVLDGVISRRVSIGEANSTELLGSGDIARPWQTEGDGGLIPCEATWEVIHAARLAVLDRGFVEQIAPWPGLTAELFARTVRRSRWQALAVAIGHLKRVDLRLLIVMWHLAERWGRVTPKGVVIPLNLTHERLARLIGAQRPSVTTALNGLIDRDVLSRRSDRSWLLRPRAQDELDLMCAQVSGSDGALRAGLLDAA